MKIFATVITFQKIPIWRDFVFADSPPDLAELNKAFQLFGDCLFAQEITNQETIERIFHKTLCKLKDLQNIAIAKNFKNSP